MTHSFIVASALVGIITLSAASGLADEPATVVQQSAPVIIQQPAPVIIQQPAPVIIQQPAAQPAPAVVQQPAAPPAPVVVQQPAAQPAPVVVNPPRSADRGGSRGYPGLVWGGILTWGVAYSAAAITAAAADDGCDAAGRMCIRGAGGLWIPVVGPFITLANIEGENTATKKTMLVVDGAFQLAGVAMAVSGLIMSASAASERRPTAAKLVVAPYVGSTTLGLGAVGRF